jgi:hypothetical protein
MVFDHVNNLQQGKFYNVKKEEKICKIFINNKVKIFTLDDFDEHLIPINEYRKLKLSKLKILC